MAYLLMEKAGKFFGYQGKRKAGTTEHELTTQYFVNLKCTKLKIYDCTILTTNIVNPTMQYLLSLLELRHFLNCREQI